MRIQPGHKQIWRIRWEGSELIGPDGRQHGPIWGNRPDVEIVHHLLDQWQEEFQLLESMPCIDRWSFWWTLRFQLAHFALVRILPQLRLLERLRIETTDLPSQIIVQQPPTPWWGALFKIVFPDCRVTVQQGRNDGFGRRLYRTGIRARLCFDAYRRLRRLSPGDPRRPRILVVSRDRTWTGRFDAELETVIDALKAAGLEVVVLVQAAGRAHDKQRAIRTRPRDHIWEDFIYLHHLLHYGYPKCPKTTMPAGGMMVQGYDLTKLIGALSQSYLTHRYQQHFILARSIPDIIGRIGPQAAVMTDENAGNHGIKLGLKRAGIPTIAVQHGVIHPDHLAYIYPRKTNPGKVALCDYTCVYGAYERDILVNQSIYPPGSVIVTGQVQMDRGPGRERSYGQRGLQGRELRDRFLPERCSRLLLFTSQAVYRPIVAPILLRALAQSDQRNFLVIRPHPGEPAGLFWRQLIERYGLVERTLVRNEESLDQWLDACDVHVSATSTVLGEAVVWGRPNIIISASNFGDWMGCLSGGTGVDLDDFSGLDDALEYWLGASDEQRRRHESDRRRYIDHHFYRLDGGAGQRIAAVVEKALNETSGGKTKP